MKRLAVLILTFLMLLSTSACSVQTRQDKVLSSVGKYENEQFWSHGDFQDYTDFGIYTFSKASLDDNEYFSIVTEDDIETFNSFLDNFESWVDAFKDNDPKDELVLNYSFDRSVIDTDDYFYVYENENSFEYGSYDLWLFDIQTDKLYYFHHNI